MSLVAKKIISDIITWIEPNDSGEKVLSMMNIFQVEDLPLVKNGILVNIINKDDVLTNGFEKNAGEYKLNNSICSVSDNCHIFNIIDRLAKNNLSLIPVVDTENKYLGCITRRDIFQHFGDIFTFEFPGSIIEIEMPVKDYSLSKISQIVESEGISIIGLMINKSNSINDNMDVIIKLNRRNISAIIASFERYEYQINASFSSDNYSSELLKERYDALMHYLNV